MPEIKIKLDDKAVLKLLNNLKNRSANLRPIMREIAGNMLDAVEENFEKEGRPKWKPLKPSTIKQRRREGSWPGKILQRSGQLASSIQSSYSHNSASVFTNKIYAAIQQLGGKAGRGRKATIPPRPFLKLTKKDINDIRKILTDYLLK